VQQTTHLPEIIISLQPVREVRFVSGILLLFAMVMLASAKQVFSQNEEMEEIPVTVRIQGVGAATFNPLYVYDTGMLLLPVSGLFQFLRLKAEPSATLDTLSGFIVDEEKKYIIDNRNKQIIFNGQLIPVDESRLIKTETALYLDHLLFGEIFGLYCRFNFRSLSVEIKPDFELPVIREMKLRQFRKNIEQLKGEVEVDTTLNRQFHLARFGMADWAVSSTQSTANTNDTRVWLATGAELFGGETNLLFHYSTRDGLNHRNQQYYWRWANNQPRAIRQIRIGKIIPSGVSSIYDPVVGISATNARTTYRRSFGEYTITDFTEPGWTVELYVNNVIVDYQTADASGFYSFNVPLVYGTSQVMLKFYGPYGEERIREQFLNIPFNFLPPGELEYTVSSGVVLDGEHSRFGRAEAKFGLNRFITLGGGFEYLSSVVTGTDIPFLTASITPVRNLMITGEYAKGVRTKALASYRLASGPSLELEYVNYVPGQKAIRLNYLEEKRATLSLPLRLSWFNGYSRMSYRQNVYEMITYNTADITFSSYIGKVNANMSAYANWLGGRDPFIYGNIGMGIRMRHGFTFRPQSQIDITNSAITSVKAELEKRISRQGYLSIMGEENFRSDYRSINLSFRWDFSFAQVNLSTRISNSEIASTQGAQGSFAFGSGNGYVHADNRSAIGRSGVAVVPFVDINHNGIRDGGEPVAAGVAVRMNGGRVIRETKDSIIRITGLEPYTSYVLTLDDKGLNQISYRIAHKTIRVYVDPNQFKKIDIPVKPMGEVNGWVFLKDGHGTKGQGRILVNIYTKSGSLVTTLLTERDGGFTYLGLTPGDYYARVDSAQLARLNWHTSPENIEFKIQPDFFGDIVYDLEFLLTKPEERAEESLPVQHENTLNQIEVPVSVPEKKPIETIPELTTKNDSLHFQEQPMDEKSYSIQIGAFKSYQNARELAEKFESSFEFSVSVEFEDDLYKVRAGVFKDRLEALEQKEFIESNGWNCFLVLVD
jgi:hypothetical protein